MNAFLRILFLTFFVAASSAGQEQFIPSSHVPTELLNVGSALISKAVSWTLLKTFQTGRYNVMLNNISLPIVLPQPLPDPLNLPSIDIPFNITLPQFVLDGFLALCEPQVTGLSGLQENILVSYDLSNHVAGINLDISFDRNITSRTNYITDVHMKIEEGEQIMEVNANGAGPASVDVSAFWFSLNAEMLLALSSGQKMSLTSFDFDFGFDNISIRIENLMINGNETNVDEALEAVIRNLYEAWPFLKDRIMPLVKCNLDHVINDCVPLDLLSGVYDCLKIEINPACFGQGNHDIMEAMEELAVFYRADHCVVQTDIPTSTTDSSTSDGSTGASSTVNTTPSTTTETRANHAGLRLLDSCLLLLAVSLIALC